MMSPVVLAVGDAVMYTICSYEAWSSAVPAMACEIGYTGFIFAASLLITPANHGKVRHRMIKYLTVLPRVIGRNYLEAALGVLGWQWTRLFNINRRIYMLRDPFAAAIGFMNTRRLEGADTTKNN